MSTLSHFDPDTTESGIDVTETGVARQQAQAAQEVQAAVFLAKKFPRNEEAAFAKVIKSCGRFSFAENVEYSFPRGKMTVSGPSVYLAREMARAWGNLIYGSRVTAETDQAIIGEAYAWDLQTNARVSCEFKIEKLQQRRNKQGVTEWVKPDERDLRELVNNIAARNYRNCILSLMPSDYIDDAVTSARATVESGVKEDPDKAIKQLVVGFTKLRITPEMIDEYLEHPLATASPAEIAHLRAIWRAICDGQARWDDYVKGKGEKVSGTVTPAAAANPTVTPSTDPNRGHAAANPANAQTVSSGTPPPAQSAAAQILASTPGAAYSQADSLALDAEIAKGGAQ